MLCDLSAIYLWTVAFNLSKKLQLCSYHHHLGILWEKFRTILSRCLSSKGVSGLHCCCSTFEIIGVGWHLNLEMFVSKNNVWNSIFLLFELSNAWCTFFFRFKIFIAWYMSMELKVQYCWLAWNVIFELNWNRFSYFYNFDK